MLSVDRNGDAAVETRIRIGWNKFRQLVLVLTNKDISLYCGGGTIRSDVANGFGPFCPKFGRHRLTWEPESPGGAIITQFINI